MSEATRDPIWQALLRHAGKPRIPHASLMPLRRTLHTLGDPHERLRIVHIAGSKGKGATALYLERLLLAHGHRVATFTSPHLEHWRERFRICGRPAAETPLREALRRVEAAVQRTPGAGELRFFERLTAIAFSLFAEATPDWALVETGIGGRFDATNVVRPALCIITRIEREHCDVLGESLAEIATHKAGIIKPHTPVVCAALPGDALAVVLREAERLKAPVIHAGRDFSFESVRCGPLRQRMTYRGRRELSAEVGVAAPPLVENAVLALAAFEQLGFAVHRRLGEAFAQGLPARCEFLPGSPGVIIDAAHTPASFAALGHALSAAQYRRLHLLVACSNERHVRDLGRGLIETAQRVVVTRADRVYTLPPEQMARVLREARPSLDVRVRAELAAALTEAADGLGEQDLLCITGSTYLAGRARALLAQRITPGHPAQGQPAG